jgi:hypothetical protein
MNQTESWIAEQARLLTLEDGFGPGHATKSVDAAADATVGDESETVASRSGA